MFTSSSEAKMSGIKTANTCTCIIHTEYMLNMLDWVHGHCATVVCQQYSTAFSNCRHFWSQWDEFQLNFTQMCSRNPSNTVDLYWKFRDESCE